MRDGSQLTTATKTGNWVGREQGVGYLSPMLTGQS